jgi:uracil-DNA glycosylase
VPLFEDYTQSVFASYHPAAALYNGSMRGTLVEDFAKVKEYIL